MHATTTEKQGIQDWDPHTMTGYSDGFSYLSDKSDVMKKSFSFITDKDGIITPDEKNYSNDKGDNDKTQPKTKLDGDFETFMSQRKFDVPASIPKI